VILVDEEKDIVTEDNSYELIEEETNEKDKKSILLVLILLLCLFFFGMSVSIALVFSKTSRNENVINVGSVLFSYDEGNNSIRLDNAIPISDSEGMSLVKEDQYFDFVVAVGFSKEKKKQITYELSLIPDENNTIDQKYIRVHLKADKNAVLINKKAVLNFSELEKSDKRPNSKLLLKKTVSTDEIVQYEFRMWLSNDYVLDGVSRTFRCYIGIDSY